MQSQKIVCVIRYYFSHVSDKKMYRKNLVPQVCLSFHISAKTRPNYGCDFLTLHIGIQNVHEDMQQKKIENQTFLIANIIIYWLASNVLRRTIRKRESFPTIYIFFVGGRALRFRSLNK